MRKRSYSNMLTKLISPFIFFIQEIRRDNAFRKQVEDKKMKRLMLGAMGQLCIVLFGLLIMYYSVIGYVIIAIIELEPLALIGVGFIIFTIWIWTLFAKKLLIPNKIKYLKKEKVYEEYQEAAEHIK